jgi:hypothetical protein
MLIRCGSTCIFYVRSAEKSRARPRPGDQILYNGAEYVIELVNITLLAPTMLRCLPGFGKFVHPSLV